MDSKNILDIGSILSDFNQGAVSKFGKFFQDKLVNQDKKETITAQADKYEDKGPIGDYDAEYQDICRILDIIREKWGVDDIDSNLFNPYYQRDLLYLYDRITLDMNYLNEYPDKNYEWLDKLLEVKYEIRNLF